MRIHTVVVILAIVAFLTIAVAAAKNDVRMPFPDFNADQAHNPFSFIVYGDIQKVYQDGHRKLVDLMQKQSVDFILNTGDISPNDGQALDQRFHSEIRDLSSRIPYFPALGNHDMKFHSESSRHPFRNFFENAYDYLSTQPFNEHLLADNNQRLWYAFRYATALFVVLDSNLFIETGKYGDTHSLPPYRDYSAEQFRWVRDLLEESSHDETIKSKFVFFHHSPFISKENTSVMGFGGHENDRGIVDCIIPASDKANEQYLLDLFRIHGVTAVFSGHEHYYERWSEIIDEDNGEIRNLNWIVVGSGGVKPRSNVKYGDDDLQKLFETGEIYERYLSRISNINPKWSARMERSFPKKEDVSGAFQNYMMIHVDQGEVRFQTVDAEGRTRDSGFLSTGESNPIALRVATRS